MCKLTLNIMDLNALNQLSFEELDQYFANHQLPTDEEIDDGRYLQLARYWLQHATGDDIQTNELVVYTAIDYNDPEMIEIMIRRFNLNVTYRMLQHAMLTNNLPVIFALTHNYSVRSRISIAIQYGCLAVLNFYGTSVSYHDEYQMFFEESYYENDQIRNEIEKYLETLKHKSF